MITRRDVGCVVVLFDPNDSVLGNIRHYREIVGEVILVDNSEKDNSIMFSGWDYIPLCKNTGIAHALNEGIVRIHSEYIITMDQDSVLTADIVDAYVDFLNTSDNSDIGALTCKYNTDRHCERKSEGIIDVRLSMQSGTLFKKKVFEQIGYFYEALFIEAVDLEYFLRMKKNGLRLVRVNEAVLDHHPAFTVEKKFGLFKLKYGVASPVRYYYQARNLLWTAKKYHSAALYKKLAVKWLKIVLLFNDKKKYLVHFRKGLYDARHGRLGKALV